MFSRREKPANKWKTSCDAAITKKKRILENLLKSELRSHNNFQRIRKKRETNESRKQSWREGNETIEKKQRKNGLLRSQRHYNRWHNVFLIHKSRRCGQFPCFLRSLKNVVVSSSSSREKDSTFMKLTLTRLAPANHWRTCDIPVQNGGLNYFLHLRFLSLSNLNYESYVVRTPLFSCELVGGGCFPPLRGRIPQEQ